LGEDGRRQDAEGGKQKAEGRRQGALCTYEESMQK
jgi:hypothetical protein